MSVKQDNSDGLEMERSLVQVNRLRGQGLIEEAAARCRELIEAWPDSWEARELLGDIYRQQNRLSDAMAQYREALKRNSNRVVIEDKIARAALVLAQPDIMRAQVEMAMAEFSPRSPGLAAALSVFLPGLGQAYNRHYLKAVALIALMALCLIILSLSLGARLVQQRVARIGVIDLLAMIAGSSLRWWAIAAVAVWLYGVADAVLSAERISEKGRLFSLGSAQG